MSDCLATIRASSLPLAYLCPGSVRGGEIRIDPHGEEAELGTAVHTVLAMIVGGSLDEVPDLRAIALRHDVDVDDLGRLAWYGLTAWRLMRPAFPNPALEVEMTAELPGFTLTGHADVLSLGSLTADGHVRVADWKSGRKDTGYYHQLMAYALLVLLADERVATVSITTVWLRDQVFETFTASRESVMAWRSRLINEVWQWDGVFHPGGHCEHCQNFGICVARNAAARSALADLNAIEPAALAEPGHREIALPQLLKLYRMLPLVEGACQRVRDAIREEVSLHGSLPTGDGKELRLVSEKRDEIDPLKAWPILSTLLTDEELAKAIRITKTPLLEAVADKAPRGHKGQAKDDLMASLTAAGAVTTKEIHKLREVRSEPVPA